MMTLRCSTINLKNVIIGKITFSNVNLFKRNNSIIVANGNYKKLVGYSCIIALDKDKSFLPSNKNIVYDIDNAEMLNDGDIVMITTDGYINILHKANSADYSIFLTNLCNSRCIMCPQPAMDDPKDMNYINMKALSLIKKNSLNVVGITGGEPTVVLESLCQCLTYIKQNFNDSIIFLLTNGRRLSNPDVIKKIAIIKNKKILYCIPIYSDNDEQHDLIVGVKGALRETIAGIHNLFRLNQKIEIRIVIMRQNYRRLKEIAYFIYRNLPFVAHVTFMGMEYVGEAEKNCEKVQIDPLEYSKQLYEAVWELHRRDINVSIYNIPLCLLSNNLWRFSKDSISEWKKIYVSECERCIVKERCGGLFGTSFVQSSNISAIV